MHMRNLAHIGVGNFHRSHQAEYFQQLNASNSDEQWNIVGISLMPQDEPLLKQLEAQNFEYHLIKRAPNGVEEVSEINVIQDVIYAYKERERAINYLAQLKTEIISFTITEGAYLYDLKSKQLNWQHPDLIYDINNLDEPKTIFGLLFNVLKERRQLHGQGVTLMSCDNVRHNGVVLKHALIEFIMKADAELAEWVNSQVCFPCTMVDRITPAFSSKDQQHLMEKYGILDNVPVICETFRQWVIEDKFRFARPNLDQVGVIYAADVTPFEDLKIKLLNGGHSSFAYLASLAQYQYVHEAVANKDVLNFVKLYMKLDARPSLSSTPGINVDDYIETLLGRFANVSIADTVDRLCGDGISKLSNFLMPVAKDAIESSRPLKRIAVVYASYFLYLKRAVAQSDEVMFGLYEPQADAESLKRYSQDPLLLLQRLGVGDEQSAFVQLVFKSICKIEEQGIMTVLDAEELVHA